ncbi:proton-coupled folate transporter-like [Penaeus japonicus]|uniref:proton-coupled folate transporter-like n=1 Tax=Penaeus japonicus TaxID=27405 RepID=UPI001C715AAD|nr:proton-coupled folate transporter-like [Penaeus japonicus]
MASSRSDEKTPLLKESPASKSPPSNSTEKVPQTTERTEPSCCTRVERYLSNITVEPALLLHSLSYAVEGIFKTNMVVDKTCSIQLQYSGDVCTELDSGNYGKQQDTVQAITNKYNMYSQWIEMGPAVFVLIFMGMWSDRRSRRLPLLLPMLGSTIKALGLMANAYFWSLQPYFILLSYIPYGLTGGMMTAFMAAYAYVSDTSGTRSRTTRLSFAGVMMMVASPLGHALGTVLFKYGGYTLVFGVEFAISALSAVYIVLRFDDKPPQGAREGGENKIFSLDAIKSTFQVVFKEREGRGRPQILGHIACICLYVMSYDAMSFLFLYTRKKFQWNYYDYTIFSMCMAPVSVLGTFILLPILSYRLKIEDGILAFISTSSHIFNGVLMGTAPAPWVLYFAVWVTGLFSFAITCSRGALSKLVEHDELGAVFSVIGMGESLLPVLATPLNTAIYNSTLEVFPGTVFLVEAGMSIVITVIYVWLLTSFQNPEDKKATV